MAFIALVAWVLFGRELTHYLDVGALMASVAIVFGGAAAAAATAFFSFRAVRRRRALAGGCVACEMKCQHAMTDGSGRTRLWLISTADRGAPVPVSAGARPLVMLPTPRWPDRPLRDHEGHQVHQAHQSQQSRPEQRVRVPAGTR